jgi:hypothetical protein
MKRNILVFGAISGLIVSTFMATSMAIMGCSAGESGMGVLSMVIGFASMAAAFAFIFVAIKNYRDKQNGGVVTFGKAFLMGILVSLIASTMYVITWGIEFHYFLPDFIDKYSSMQIKELQANGITGAVLEEKMKGIQDKNFKYKNNIVYFTIATYMEIFPVGIIMSLIGALILKRKTPKVQLEAKTETI